MIKVQEINIKHKIFLVPSEKLTGQSVNDLKFCDDNGKELEVLAHFSHNKNDIFPSSLYRILFGRDIDPEEVWEKYKWSETMIILVCE